MKKVLQKLLVCIPFLLIVFGISCGTMYPSLSGTLETVWQDGFDVNMAEDFVKERLLVKSWFREMSGIIQRLTGHRLTSDGQFYRDSDGIMHLRWDKAEYRALIESTGCLADQMAKKNIPFLVCQTAERASYGDDYSSFLDGDSLEYLEPLKDVLSARKTPYLNCQEIFEKERLSASDIFLKTDVHCTTRAELLILESVVAALEKEYGLHFPDKDLVLNLENYRLEEYDFLGNLGYTHGISFSGKDRFQYFLPEFDTSLSLENPSQEVSRSGGFETVCMNGYRDAPGGDGLTIYRVTDYMQWPSPYYTIENHLSEGPRVVVIGDSMSMRTTAYLTLLCKRVTVIDPRYFDGHNYLKNIDFHQVDAVVFFPSVNLQNGINAYDAEVQSCRFEANENGKFDLYITVKNVGMVSWYPEDAMRMGMWTEGNDSGIRAELPEGQVIAPDNSAAVVFRDLNLFSLSKDASIQMLGGGSFFGEKAEIMESDSWSEVLTGVLEHLPEEPAQSADYWIGRQGICIDTCNGVPIGDAEWIVVSQDRELVEIVGWAADFNAQRPLSALYLQIGERIIPCSYGLERTSVSDHFGNTDLTNTGFTVTFPASYLRENPSTAIQFIGVSADGTYRYEPVLFRMAFPPTALAEYQAQPISYQWDGAAVTVTIQNTSSAAWLEKDLIRAGIFSDGSDTGLRGYLPENVVIEPGENAVFEISLEGQESLLSHNLEVTMLQETICYFGEKMSISVS